MLTARATLEDKINGLQTGADDYLQKPFDMNELQIRIKNLLNQRQILKKKFASETGLALEYFSVTSADKIFVKKIMALINDQLANPALNVDRLAGTIGMSRMQLHRKIQGLFGQSPGVFLRTIRLKRAAELLKNKTGNILEIAYLVGFENHATFSSAFQRQFGKSPSDYQRRS